jgi:hypothetical protein
MIGIVVLTGVSWFLLWFVIKKNLFTLWFTPASEKGIEVIIGLGIAMAAFGIPLALKTLTYSIDWQLNPDVNTGSLLSALFFYFKSIMFEELVFRGAILTLLAHFARNKTAILISAISFGVYHWFSYGMFGSGIVPMTYIFLLTGGMGYAWAYIYIKTNSIIMPAVIHLTWNYLSALFLDYQPFGQLLFRSDVASEYSSLVDFGIQAGGELASILLIFGLFQFYLRYKKRADLHKPALS